MSLLMFSMTAKAVPRSVRKLLNFGQFIPYPVLAGMMVSVGIYLIKMAMFLITSSANPNNIPVTALLHSKPELLPVVGVALVPPAILYLLTLLPNQDSLVPKNGLLIVMAATAIVPNILAFAGILSRDASFLFLPTSLMAPSPSAVSVSPLYNCTSTPHSTQPKRGERSKHEGTASWAPVCTKPSACTTECTCDLSGRGGGSGGLPPTAPSFARFRR
jgi:hypothetical protein